MVGCRPYATGTDIQTPLTIAITFQYYCNNVFALTLAAVVIRYPCGMRPTHLLILALATTACGGSERGGPVESTNAAPTEAVEACLVAARAYAEPSYAPCAETLRASAEAITSGWAAFTPYQRFFLRQALAPTTFPVRPDDAAQEACAAVANAPVHWFGAPVISPTALASALVEVPGVEACLMPLVMGETRESFLDDGEGNAMAQASALTRGDVAAWFVAQVRHETFTLSEPDRAAHRARLALPEEAEPAIAPTPVSPFAEVDARLRGACSTRDVARHVRTLHAAAAVDLDASCANEDFASFGAWIDAYNGPTVTRSGACEETRCLLRLESVGERSVSALHVWYTRESATTPRSIRCEVLRGG